MDKFSEDIIKKIKNGGVGIIPTDTMYGIVASVTKPDAIEKLYLKRHRNPKKQSIVLISDINELELFGIKPDIYTKNILNTIWPGPFSIEMEVSDSEFSHLTRGNGKFAVRFPKNEMLQELISKTGPIIAPSANMEGEPPAETLADAKEYFPDLDFYVDGGVLKNNPSTVISIIDNKVKIWRQGQGIVPEDLLQESVDKSS
jgi:L-threonylcarbamoyladenylate synthase